AEPLPCALMYFSSRLNPTCTEQLANCPVLFSTHVLLEYFIGKLCAFHLWSFPQDTIYLIAIINGSTSHIEHCKLKHSFLLSKLFNELHCAATWTTLQPLVLRPP